MTLRLSTWTICLLALFSGVAMAQHATIEGCDTLAVESPERPFEAFVYNNLAIELSLRNVSDKPLTIKSVRPRKPPGKASVDQPQLAPGEATTVRITKPLNGLGSTMYGFPIVLDGGPPITVCMLKVWMFVQSAYRPENLVLQLADVVEGTRSKHRVEVTSFEAASLKILDAKGFPDWIAWSVPDLGESQTAAIDVEILEHAPRGYYSGSVQVTTDLATQTVLPLQLAIDVFGDVVPERSRVDLGGKTLDEPIEADVKLTHRQSRPFDVTGIVSDNSRLTGKVIDCGEGCKQLRVSIDSSRTGQFRGNVQIELSDGLGSIILPVTTWITPADRPVIDLGTPSDKPITVEGGKPVQ